MTIQSAAKTLLFLPLVFIAMESTRAALWAARVADESDHDGPLLRALVARLVSVLGMIPSPIWTVATYMALMIWVPIRAVLWVWGIGRGQGRMGPSEAVREWHKQRTIKLRRRRRQKEYDMYE